MAISVTNDIKGSNEKTKLSIEAKNFGPVAEGNVDIKPLTIFIGPNNSGKSYIAMLISSILETLNPQIMSRDEYSRRLFLSTRRFSHNIDFNKLDTFPEFYESYNILRKGEEIEIPPTMIKSLIKELFNYLFEVRLSEEIPEAFACGDLKELILNGQNNFSFKIQSNSFSADLKYKKQKIILNNFTFPDFTFKIRFNEKKNDINIIEKNKNEITFLIDPLLYEQEKEFLLRILSDKLIEVIDLKLFGRNPKPHFYLPAARSGTLQGLQGIITNILKNVTSVSVGKKRPVLPKFSGVVTEFLTSFLNLPEEKGPFFDLTREFEHKLIKGDVLIRFLDDYTFPEFFYKFEDMEIPIHRASSTVSELAPIFIYLKYIVKPGTILIIEEPEAHLHPKNQRILAEILVHLVRNSVSVILTTHSEYLLEQFNNFLALNEIEPEKRENKYNYTKETYLTVDDISAYSFEYDKGKGGHILNEVLIDEQNGISLEEFIKVKENLYEEAFLTQRDLEDSD